MRDKVTEAIKVAFGKIFPEASFRNDFTAYAGKNLALPCVWLSPIEMIGKTGRKEGRKTYRAELVIFGKTKDMDEETKAVLWKEYECVAMRAIEALYAFNDIEIVAINNIRCAPEEYSISGYQAVSMKVSIEIEVLYCDQSSY